MSRHEGAGEAGRPSPPSPAEAARLRRRGVRLEWLTIAWNVGEAVVTIVLGVTAGSIALVAFGSDSVVEVFASAVVVWHEGHPESPPGRTRRALRMIALAFFALAVVLLAGSVQRLVTGAEAGESLPAILYLAVTVVVMLVLARLKHATGRDLGSKPLLAEAHVTFLDAGLAAGVLAALALNSLLGWWWADPAAAIVVAAAAVSEGREAWAGEVA